MHLYKFPAALLLCILFFSSCQKNDENPAPLNTAIETNEKIQSLLKEWYLWNDQLPDINAGNYDNPENFLDALLYKDIDKWSYIQDVASFDQYFEEGKFYGFGFGMKLDTEDNLRVSFVYRNSPMDKAGVTRGYKILKIDGKPVSELIAANTLSAALGPNQAGVSVQFEVENPQGMVSQHSLIKEEVTINSVIHREIRDVAGVKVGYLVFNNFIDTSVDELNEAFAYFKNEGISELALDLRYNGGGSLKVAQHLANLIGASKAGTNKFVELTYNAQKQDTNQPFNFSSEASGLTLDRLFVITARGTASASEAIINGLRPYMEVLTVGDFTGGKPVGMNVWKFDGYALVPITFKVLNAQGEAEYFDGIQPNGFSGDDVTVLFGDNTEDSFGEVLYYIQNGAFSAVSARAKEMPPVKDVLNLRGFQAEVGAF